MQMAADALSRLHIRNLHLSKNEEEKDPAVIRMMERGEGEDDELMFNDATFAHSIQTQTEFLQTLYNSTSIKATRAPTAQEQTLADTYGVGFDIMERMGWSEASHAAPVQLKPQADRAGLGYKSARPEFPQHCSNPANNHVNLLSCAPPALSIPTRILSCVHVADWRDDEERNTAFEECSPTLSAANLQHLSANVLTRSKTRPAAPPADKSAKKAKLASDSRPPDLSPAAPDHSAASDPLLPSALVSDLLGAVSDSLLPPASHSDLPAATNSVSEPLPAEAISALRDLLDLPIPSAIAPSQTVVSSQTIPQDFRDAAYAAAGGFPLADLLRRAHDDTHPSFLTTWRRVIRALGPQPNLESSKVKSEVRRWCDACLCCQKLQPARMKLFADIGSIRQRPFTSYAFDVVTLSHPDSNGVRYILCCVDSFSRAVELFGLRQANASSVVECLNDVLCRWGRGHELRCDNAKAFTSAVVKALLKRAKVKQHLTAPYSHQSNGQVENCNRRVMDVLRAMILDDRLGPNTQLKWSLLLPEVRRVLMTRTVTQHGLTPNDLAFMNCPETEASIFEEESWMPPMVTPQQDEPEWLIKLHQQHEALIDICDEKQDELLQKLAELNFKNREQSNLRSIQVHDFVLLKLAERPQKKDQPRWAGPYLVIAFPDNDQTRPMVTLQHLSSKVVGDFHLNMLKFCDMSLMKQVEDAIPYAAKDNFEYEIEAIMSHQPLGPRKTSTGLRNKSEYEFKCLWKDLPLGEDNPSWEPWSNDSMRQCEAYLDYTKQQHIIDQLGAKF
jgi:transposase InsO family protein